MNASDAVDLYSGEAQLTLDLVHLAGRNGLDLRVSLVYSSRVYDAATTWNLTEPTGVLGLGWSLPFYGIAATYGANVSDVSYFLIAGGDSGPLACTGVNADGTRRFQGENFRFWQITYDPARQRWTIVHEDGNTWILGDINSGRGTVQWSVRWDNWRGASAEQDGQSPVPLVFSLSEIANRFGDRITWEYETVPQIVGPARSGESPAYTQGCYLKRLTGVNGETVVFTYADKTVDATIQEYVVPHTPGPPNAYQDRYLTRYLASLTAFAADGTPCFTQQFLYTDASGQPAFLGTGAFAKRLLTGVRQIPAGVTTWLPEPRFAYGGQDTEDQVSLTTPFNATTRRLYGALKHLTMPEGGVIAYDYAAITPTLSSRTVSIQPPVQTGVTFSAPRFHFARDFVVCTWLGSDNAMRVRTSSWDGRWIAPGQQQAALDSLPVASAADYDQAPVACDTSLFGAFSQNQVHLYRADSARAGMWIQPSVTQGGTTVNYFTTTFAAGEPVRFVTGDRFAAVLGRSGGTLCRYRFTGAAWTADPAVSLVPGPGPVLYDAAARDNFVCAIAAPQTGGSPLRVSLFVSGQTGDWQTSTFSVDRELSSASALTVTPGETFAIVMLTATALPQIQTEYIACWWSADGMRLSSQSLGVFTTTGAALAPSVRGSSVAIGETLFRFDGITWANQNISASPLQAIAYGDDLVLRILQGPGAQFTYALTQYLPDSGTWASAVSLTAAAATNINAAAQGGATISPFAIVDSTLYHRAPDATWAATSLTLPALTGNDALSVVLAEGRFLVYQQTGNTVVVPLKNGASLAAVTLTGQQVYTPETSLVGTQAYVTYTGTFGASGSTLTLSRVVEDAGAGAIECYVVGTRTASNGYQSTPTAYVYNAATAIADQARALRSNQTTSVIGADVVVRPSGWIDRYAFNGLCPDETPALPYPVDPSFTNAPDFYTFVAGLVYDLRTYPTEAAPSGFKSEDITETWVYPVTLGQVARGLYQRTLKMSGSVDGVATETTSTFSATTGLVTQLTSNNYNSLGQPEQSVTLYKYFWEVYDTSRLLNLLTPLAQTTMQTVANATTTVTGMFVTTFRDDWGSGSGRWAPDRTYRALSDAAPAFTSWRPDQPDPTGWLRTSTTLDVNAFGLPRRMATVDGLVAASLYDTSNLMAVATFMNADPDGDEATYYGFDPYEDPDGWSWSGSGTLASHITTDQWHTGVQCLRLAGTSGRKDGPVRRLFPAGQSRVYVFGVWVKTTPGFDPAAGQASFTVDVYAVATNQLVTTLNLAISDTKNAWAYLQRTIDLPSIRTAAQLPPSTPLYLWVSGWNQNTAATVFADNLRFSPIDATMSVTVYDPVRRLVTATLDTNGQTTRIVYDEYDRTVVTIGPGECVTGVSAESYSRDLTAARTFLPTFPNMRLSLTTSSESAYYDFHDAVTSDWALTGAGGTWNFTGGQLVFAGTSTDPLGSTAAPTKFAFTNFGARVTCTAHTGAAGLGNGDAFVLWDPDASAWRLVRRQTSGAPVRIAINSDVGFRPDWVYIIVDGMLLFFAGGVIVFAYAYQDPNVTLPNYGQPSLMLTKDGAFDDLVVLNNPQLTLSFCDGTGQKLQSVTLLGYAGGTTYATTSEGRFLDTLGRPHIMRKTAGPPLALAAPPSSTADRTGELVKGGETTYLVNSAGQSVSLVDYLMGRFGFDYTRFDFEPSPLSRVAAIVLPREQAQPEDKFTIKYEYGQATADVIANVLPVGTEQHYLMRTTTDQDGVVRYDLLDQAGKVIAIRVRTGSTTFVTAAAVYDAAGALVTVKPPNAFDPPANSTASTWLETRTYTFNGLLASRTAPDEGSASIPGTTSHLYDKADRLRFSSTPDGAALTPPLFLYVKYDVLGRCIEEGDIQAAGVTWATLAGKVDDPTYPDLATVAGRWTKRRTYDVTAGGDAMNLLGRLWRVSVNNGTQDSTADTETHAYDVRGNVIGVVTSVPSVSAAPYTSAYAYDNQGRVTVITYPYLAGETPFQTAYYYDRAGRTAAIGKPVDPFAIIDPSNPATGNEDLYASYAYNGTGALSQEQLNNRTVGGVDLAFSRAYTYNEPGWLTRIDDPFFTQELAYYEQPGYGGTTYYSGVTARSLSQFKPRPGPPVPRSYGYVYGYDALKRLRAAASDRTTSAATMLIGPQGYDANGNVRQRTRGMAIETYRYQQSATDTTQRNNQVFDVTAQGAASLDFSGDLTGWTWGASNNGPSTSRLVPHNGGQALELGGGSLGHYEYLQVESYLPPRGVYRLTYQVNTPADFAQGTGDARWFALVRTADGNAAQVVIGTVPDTNGTWQQSTIDNVDLGAILSSLAPDAVPVSVVFQLRNARRATTGTTSGVAFTVATIQIATTADVVGGAYAYTLAGAVQAAPDRGITQITYDPVTTRPRRIERADGTVEALTYDATDNRLTLTMGGETVAYVRGADGSPLRTERRNGAATSIVYNVFGERGLLGVADAAGMAFTLTDKLGSTRVLVRDTNEVLGRLDYLPGGETFRQGGTVGTPYEYSGQEWDDRIKLYAYPARLYDPVLGRFYAIDIAGGSPYVLAGSNPIDCIDSSGDLPEWVNDAGAALQGWSGTALSEAGRLCREHPYVVGATVTAVALGGAYVAAPLATIAAFQEIAAVIVGGWNIAFSTGVWVVTHPRMSAQLALIGYRFHTSPTWSSFVLQTSVDVSVSVVSSHTIVRVFHFLDARFIVERWRPVTWTLGLASVAAQGAVTGQFRRNVWWFIGVQGANDASLLTRENLLRDAATNVVAHALFDSVDFRNGLSPRTPYPPTAATELHIMYLAFPAQWQYPSQWLYWRGWLVPYKGIARGNGSPLDVAAIRHNHHHWSPFGFGPNFPIASSFNHDAIRYLERLVIHWMPAQRITGAGVGTYQKDDWNGPLTATWRDDFLEEFVYWHFRHAFAHMSTPVEAIAHAGGSMINASIPLKIP